MPSHLRPGRAGQHTTRAVGFFRPLMANLEQSRFEESPATMRCTLENSISVFPKIFTTRVLQSAGATTREVVVQQLFGTSSPGHKHIMLFCVEGKLSMKLATTQGGTTTLVAINSCTAVEARNSNIWSLVVPEFPPQHSAIMPGSSMLWTGSPEAIPTRG